MLEAITPAKQGDDGKTGGCADDGGRLMTRLSQSWPRRAQQRAWAGLLGLLAVWLAAPVQAQDGQRVSITGEIADSWCTVSGLMFAKGSAHHQCAVWCALGGIPVAIRDAEGGLYLILRIGDDTDSAANPRIARLMARKTSGDTEYGACAARLDRTSPPRGSASSCRQASATSPSGSGALKRISS